MNDKQIYAALEISDHEVRLIVGEFFRRTDRPAALDLIDSFGKGQKQ